MIASLFLAVLSFAVVLLLYFLTKGTHFEFGIKNGNVWSIILLREMLLIFLPLVLLQLFGVGAFRNSIHYADDTGIFRVSLLTIYSMGLFVICLSLFSRLAPVPHERNERIEFITDPNVERFAKAALISAVSLLIFAMLFLNYRHVFLDVLFSGENIIKARLGNVYSSGLPSQLAYLIVLCSWVLAIYSAILLYQARRRKAIFYLLSALLLASARGDKAPALMVIIIGIISYFSLSGSTVSIKKILVYVPLYLLALISAIYFVVALQIPDLTIGDFFIYLSNRLGVGQMAGVFETFAIPSLSGDFYWHMVPFASIFVDYPIYDKALMMFVEGYDFDQMGVKNSLFISEAYGIGGWWLMLVSPIIVGFSWALGARLIFVFIRRLFGHAVALMYALPIFILASPLTGGFSSFPFFKGLILNMLALSVIWFVFKLSTITLARR